MSAFEQLERQLKESVAARSRLRPTAVVGGFGRWWKERGRWRVLTLAAAASVLVALLAAPRIERPPTARAVPGAEASAEMLEAPCAPCRALSGRLHASPAVDGSGSPADGAGSGQRAVAIQNGLPRVGLAPRQLTSEAEGVS